MKRYRFGIDVELELTLLSVPRHYVVAVDNNEPVHSRDLGESDSVELTIKVPASLADAGAGERARVLLVLDGVRSERMTWRAAASALGITPDELLDLARTHGVPVVHYEATDLQDDLSTLAKLERGRAPGA